MLFGGRRVVVARFILFVYHLITMAFPGRSRILYGRIFRLVYITIISHCPAISFT